MLHNECTCGLAPNIISACSPSCLADGWSQSNINAAIDGLGRNRTSCKGCPSVRLSGNTGVICARKRSRSVGGFATGACPARACRTPCAAMNAASCSGGIPLANASFCCWRSNCCACCCCCCCCCCCWDMLWTPLREAVLRERSFLARRVPPPFPCICMSTGGGAAPVMARLLDWGPPFRVTGPSIMARAGLLGALCSAIGGRLEMPADLPSPDPVRRDAPCSSRCLCRCCCCCCS